MVAKGFGKNYFRLTAITATVSAVNLQRRACSIKELRFERVVIFDQNEDPPPEEPTSAPAEIDKSSKPCYCNIFFACLAHKILKLSKIKKPPLCKCRYTKTGIAPPNI